MILNVMFIVVVIFLGCGEEKSVTCGSVLRRVGDCRPPDHERGSRQHQRQQMADAPSQSVLLKKWCMQKKSFSIIDEYLHFLIIFLNAFNSRERHVLKRTCMSKNFFIVTSENRAINFYIEKCWLLNDIFCVQFLGKWCKYQK